MSEIDADYDAQLGILAEELLRLERRLRGLSSAAWRSRTNVVRSGLVDLVTLEARLTDSPARPLPDIAEYALADALVVIAGDVLDALSDDRHKDDLELALSAARSMLASTR